jgi:hypothetical protein
VKILSVVISGFVLVLTIVFGKNTSTPSAKNQLGAQTERTQEPSKTPTDTPLPEPTIKPTQKTVPTATPADQTATSSSLNDFFYPGSVVTSQSGSTLTLTSSDNATTITEWYSSQLTDRGFTALSTAKTNSNGNILNKIGGGKNGKQIEVTIKKTASSGRVDITVLHNNSSSSESSVHIEINNSQSNTQSNIQ